MIRQLMGWAEHFSWAVAWATNNDWTSLLLKHHSNKIKHLVVGTDFSQTSPEFIDSAITLPSVYGGPSCQDRFYDFCKHILEEVISSLRREVLVALSLRRCLV